ncbi:MAG: hypothetical protein JWM85_3535 [Acidimicrobiaceae bacterium]|nr:hypothetical protein [Acidimicrobiaceae bacterium]
MIDWASTGASAATAAGTLALAVSTLVAVRSSQRAARATEAALLANIRPLLVASRLDDAQQKVGFLDDHWIQVSGGHGVAEATDEVIYLVIALRNSGRGLAVLDRWGIIEGVPSDRPSGQEIAAFRRLTRDLYIPPGDTGFWQGALRDPADPVFASTIQVIKEQRTFTVDLLYGDSEGGQHTISRFLMRPISNGQWLATLSRHWNLDRADPR